MSKIFGAIVASEQCMDCKGTGEGRTTFNTEHDSAPREHECRTCAGSGKVFVLPAPHGEMNTQGNVSEIRCLMNEVERDLRSDGDWERSDTGIDWDMDEQA